MAVIENESKEKYERKYLNKKVKVPIYYPTINNFISRGNSFQLVQGASSSCNFRVYLRLKLKFHIYTHINTFKIWNISPQNMPLLHKNNFELKAKSNKNSSPFSA